MSFLERKVHYTPDLYLDHPLYLNLLLLFFFIAALLITRKSSGPSTKLTMDHSNVLRGFAILVIIVHHVSLKLADPEGLSFFYHLGHFGVSVFLVLSGYGLAESYKK